PHEKKGRGAKHPAHLPTASGAIGGPAWIRTRLGGLARPLRRRSATGPSGLYHVVLARPLSDPGKLLLMLTRNRCRRCLRSPRPPALQRPQPRAADPAGSAGNVVRGRLWPFFPPARGALNPAPASFAIIAASS